MTCPENKESDLDAFTDQYSTLVESFNEKLTAEFVVCQSIYLASIIALHHAPSYDIAMNSIRRAVETAVNTWKGENDI